MAKFSSTNQPKIRGKVGRKIIHKDLKAATNLTKSHLEGLLNQHLWMNEKELHSVMISKSVPMISKAIASILTKAIESGDDRRLTFILDRIIGKPKEEIDITAYMVGLKKMTTVDVVDMGAAAIRFLSSKSDDRDDDRDNPKEIPKENVAVLDATGPQERSISTISPSETVEQEETGNIL